MQEAYNNMHTEDVMPEPEINESQNNQQNINSQDYQNDYYTDSFQTVNHSETDKTTISKGTVINGNVEADGDLIIRGHIKGDVLCNANLSVYGVIEGTISCTNAFFDNALIMGDIGCSGNMEISESSTINGNIEAYNLLNGGRIKEMRQSQKLFISWLQVQLSVISMRMRFRLTVALLFKVMLRFAKMFTSMSITIINRSRRSKFPSFFMLTLYAYMLLLLLPK